MSTDRLSEKLYMECGCSVKDHLVVVDLEHLSTGEVWLNISTQMNADLSLVERVRAATRFVLGIDPCGFGHWCTALIRYKDSHRLAELLEIYQRRYEEWRDAHPEGLRDDDDGC